MTRALAYLRANAERYHVDPRRVVVGGDSAGAQLAAQLAALVTTPGYARGIGVEATIMRSHAGAKHPCGVRRVAEGPSIIGAWTSTRGLRSTA